MIKPSIGRVVLFFSSSKDFTKDSEQAEPALVSYVHSDVLVNLAIFNSSGGNYGRTSVRLVQPEEAKPTDGSSYATWMDYQIAQAAAAAPKA